MADLFDQAQDRDMLNLAQSLEVQAMRAKAAPKLVANGTCYNPRCGEDIAAGKLFCGAECAAQHSKLRK